MSDTDKTVPYKVQEARNPEPLHDHRNGVCELEGQTAPDPKHHSDKWGTWAKGACIWTSVWWAIPGCGCTRCTDQFGRKAKARKERRSGKRLDIRERLTEMED